MFVFMLVFTLALQIGNGAGSSVGRRFFGAFLQNCDYQTNNLLVVDIVSYDKSALVNVSVPELSFSQSVVLPPFTSTNISIPKASEIRENGNITSKVVSVQSDNNISVWGLSHYNGTSDGFMMIPEQDLGIEYYVVTPLPGTNNEFAILSPYNNVTVQMTLSNVVTFNGDNYTNQLNITLQENQVVMFQAPSLTGTRVFSSAPVAVFSGDWCVTVHTACNFVTEQLLPVGQWGASYLVFPVSTKSTDDSVIISSGTSADVSVDVIVNDILTTYTLSNYGHISMSVFANQSVSINASTNVGVMYICQGGNSSLGFVIDPFQMTIVPTNRFSNIYLFSTQPDFINILTIIARDADKCGILMNGERICDKIQWVTTNDLQFVAGELNLGNGSQLIRVQHASQPFGLYLYGVAFGYMLGYDNIRGNDPPPSVGRRFFGAFLQNHLANNSLVVDIVSYDKMAQVNVSVPELSFSQSVVLPPFSSTNISIPATAEITENGNITSKVVSVQSDSDITVWGLSHHFETTDGFMMIPEQYLGIEYYVVTPVPGTNNEFAILSPYNNVTVQMTLSNDVTFNGVMYTNQLDITLQENQVVMFQAPSLTGTIVFSSAPVAVFSGDSCVTVHTGCKFVTEQLLPVGQWGSSYLVFPVSTKSTDDSVIISSGTSADVSVDVSVGGNLTTYTLSNYSYINISVYSNQIVSINALTNVGVMYICQGGNSSLGVVIDPFQMTIVPTNKFSNIYLFSTQPDFINILTIIARDADKCGIVMNGQRICDKIQWVTTNDLQFVGGELNLGNGSQLIRVQHASQPFGLYLYGVADYDAFGYMLGYDNIRDGLCYAHLTDTNGSIGFVDLLAAPGATDCLWNITGAAGSAIILRFQSFSLQAGKEFVYVYDGPSTNSPLLGQYSGAGTPGPIISSSNTLIIIATYTTQIVGNFSAFYRVGSPCKQSFAGSQGLISSNNFSAMNERNALCWWSIEVDPKYEVKLRFQTFNLTADPDCINESLTVYENLNSLGVFCGSLTPPGLRSTTNKLLLVLDSLQGLQQNAVIVNYQIIKPIQVSTSCGIANVSGLSAWPWQVNVTRLLDNARCIGSLVSNSLVVTAAHCLQERFAIPSHLTACRRIHAAPCNI